MSVKLIFNDLPQYSDGNNIPYAGGKLFTYAAGSSSKQTTYQDSAGSTPHANPIVLDAYGRVPAAIWGTTGVTYKLVLAPAGDTDPPTSPIFTIDSVSPINDTSITLDQWSVTSLVATYVSGTQFTVPGDETTTLHVGRRVKVADSGGTKYGTISDSAYTTLTTVTVVLDTGTLASPISTLSVGVQTTNNPSEPILTDTFPLRSGSSDKTKKVRLEVDGLTTATTRVITMPDYNVTLGHIPAGVVMDYAGSTLPTGWLECNAAAVSRTTYADLFAAIGTTWGAGDGATTFNLPPSAGRTRIGRGTGSVAESVAFGSVNAGADTFTVVSNSAKWITGQAVVLTTTGGLPAGLALATTYYVIRSSATLIKFATSLANAIAGTAIDITTQGTGTHTLTGTLTARTLGEIGGEDTHALVTAEIPSHTHTLNGQAVQGGTPANPSALTDANTRNQDTVTQATGGSGAHNIMQPYGVYMQIIKI